MNNKNTFFASIAVLALCLGIPMAHAQNAISASTSATVTAPAAAANINATAKAKLGTDRLAKVIARSDTAIVARITALNALNTRVQAMKNISANEKSAISGEVQSAVAGLTSLKAKIDADTNVDIATADAKTITGSYRIYALVIPQGYIAASADRVATISAMMTAINAKLQARITADQTAGKDVTAMQSSLADMNAKVADANAHAQTAQASVASLTPDQDNTTVQASNTAALKAARADIKVSAQDLATARADAKSIMQGLKK